MEPMVVLYSTNTFQVYYVDYSSALILYSTTTASYQSLSQFPQVIVI